MLPELRKADSPISPSRPLPVQLSRKVSSVCGVAKQIYLRETNSKLPALSLSGSDDGTRSYKGCDLVKRIDDIRWQSSRTMTGGLFRKKISFTHSLVTPLELLPVFRDDFRMYSCRGHSDRSTFRWYPLLTGKADVFPSAALSPERTFAFFTTGRWASANIVPVPKTFRLGITVRWMY